jgi:hypothetical protein
VSHKKHGFASWCLGRVNADTSGQHPTLAYGPLLFLNRFEGTRVFLRPDTWRQIQKNLRNRILFCRGRMLGTHPDAVSPSSPRVTRQPKPTPCESHSIETFFTSHFSKWVSHGRSPSRKCHQNFFGQATYINPCIWRFSVFKLLAVPESRVDS